MKGLRTVIYKVEDLQQAKAWYTKAFGAEPYFNEPFYIGFEVGGYELGLHPTGNSQTIKSDNVLVYWAVDDVQIAYEELISIGAKPHESPQNVGGEIVVASLQDPWGNCIGIIYNPYFKL
ncbi:MAG TPA: VOC family protein [Flavobacterium sp.]